jgi:hypothetical protein
MVAALIASAKADNLKLLFVWGFAEWVTKAPGGLID